jgi:hypothetical protein
MGSPPLGIIPQLFAIRPVESGGDRYIEILLRHSSGLADYEIEAIAASLASVSLEPAANIAAMPQILIGPLRGLEPIMGINAEALAAKLESMSFFQRVLAVEEAERMIAHAKDGR